MPPGSEPVLTQRELNRTLLERQFLLKRRKLAIPRALERIGGIQAQYAPSMYIGLWSRLAGFDRDQLTRALERRTVVQGTLMRSTIHLVSREDYWPIAVAIRESRRAAWLRYHKGKPTEAEVKKVARLLRKRMQEGASARKELIEGIDTPAFNGAQQWLDIVRVPPSGTWERRRADKYGLAEEWIGSVEVTPAEGRELLVRRYLQGFGPGAPKEIGDWAGLPPREVNELLETLELRRFRDESGGLLVDLPRLAIAPEDAHAPARFLPDLGRHPAGPRAPDPDSAGEAPAEGVQHKDAAVDGDLHRRRPGGGRLEVGEGPGEASALWPALEGRALGAGGRGGAPRPYACLALALRASRRVQQRAQPVGPSVRPAAVLAELRGAQLEQRHDLSGRLEGVGDRAARGQRQGGDHPGVALGDQCRPARRPRAVQCGETLELGTVGRNGAANGDVSHCDSPCCVYDLVLLVYDVRRCIQCHTS